MTPRKELVFHVFLYAIIAFSIWMLAHVWVTMTILVGRSREWVAYAADPVTFWNWVFFNVLSILFFGWLLWAMKYRRRD